MLFWNNKQILASIFISSTHLSDYMRCQYALIEIKMKVDLPQLDIDSLISKGAKPLPLKEPTDTSILAEDTNSWLERISGIKGATNGVYFYEPGHQEPHESEFLIYDRDSQTLYYRMMIM